nr:hemolysin family protein [Veillonella sp. R32]
MIGLAVLCLLMINILVLAKFSFARLSEEHLDDMEDLSEEAKTFLRKLYQRPERFINTTQFLILFFIVLLASVGSSLIAPYIDLWEQQLGLDNEWLTSLFDIIILALFALIILTFGEIIPKALGLSFPIRYVRWTSKFVVALGAITTPFVLVAQYVSAILLKSFGTLYKNELDLVHTEEEIRMMVNRSHLEGQLDQVEGELIDNVFDFVERMAREVMIPRQDVDCIFVEDDFEDTLKSISATSHTRYPLCMEDKDHVIGLVHIKDLMEQKEKARKDLRLVRRDILTIPEVMKLSVLLQYMRTRRIYQAVVVDEYGGMVGLVCLEDIIEELVGDIKDEHETDLPAVMINDDGTFDFDGKVLVDEVEYAMHVDFHDPEEDTIGGYIFGILERTPVVGDTVEVEGYIFKVTEMQGYRIARLKATPAPPKEEVAAAEDEPT